jgi:alpha-amylase/alpha-mannosidase (GH57 family)
MNRHICIHGHFYQPPRENPWLEAIELQDSAYPYHDWNEKITAQCYSPNANSRILDGNSRIVELVNNYAKMSFNFGPTLLSWMKDNTPDTYEAIIDADRQSQINFSGHGSAIAQAYNHMILPLANRRDKHTQVVWGIRDFEYRFGRMPEGMWLPESAVDLETLEILADNNIKFTILAPSQARRTRALGSHAWIDVSGGRIDPTLAYKVKLRSARSIGVFFYDGPISQALAFEGLLNNGESVAHRLLEAFSDDRGPQLVNVATDGETYGHHHHMGDMALAYALSYIETNELANITNYSEFLDNNPPRHEVQIFENSSWSCVHGVDRWKRNCGCNSGGYPEWNQEWRQPLRSAFDWLRDTVRPLFLRDARPLLTDPWEARNRYIEVVLDRSDDSVNRFLENNSPIHFSDDERIKVLKLLELQRHLMLMYTSCGWFFDELSGIETVQVIQFASRAVQLAEDLFGRGIEDRFLKRLEGAKSNVPEHKDGGEIYRKWVKPAAVDLTKVAAHYAIGSLFHDYGEDSSIYSFNVVREDYQTAQVGREKLAIGRVKLTSRTTGETETFSFGVLHLGDHNVNCGVMKYPGRAEYESLAKEHMKAFEMSDFAEIVRLMDQHFGACAYSLRSLFRDEQRKVLDEILGPVSAEAESFYTQIHEHHAPLLRFLADLDYPVPKPLVQAPVLALTARLRKAFAQVPFDSQLVRKCLEEANFTKISLDGATLEFEFREALEAIAKRALDDPIDLAAIETLDEAVTLAQSLPFEVNLRETQNTCYRLATEFYRSRRYMNVEDRKRTAQRSEHISSILDVLGILIKPTKV